MGTNPGVPESSLRNEAEEDLLPGLSLWDELTTGQHWNNFSLLLNKW